MSTKLVDVAEAQQHLYELLLLAQQGNEVIIANGNTPIARLIPMTGVSNPRVAGLNQGAMRVRDDFNEPLPDSFWLGAV
jgi:antitoxin (DNA-binding transcriptional repressor) of toxin-antitoxin stability system